MAGFWRLQKTLSILGRTLKKLPINIYDDFKDVSDYRVKRILRTILSSNTYDRLKTLYKIPVLRGKAEVKSNQEFTSGCESGYLHEEFTAGKPLIFISACTSCDVPGYWKYNGGIKEFNCLVKLLRNHGYEAYIVTYDGQYIPWLVDHQPCISLSEFQAKATINQNIRCITSWAEAPAFIQCCSRIYFWDMELAATDRFHYASLADLYRSKLAKAAGISCTIQAWHMAHFNYPCERLPNIVDDSVWYPQPLQRVAYRVGYLDEGLHTEAYIQLIEDIVTSQDLDLEFFQLHGPEADIVAGMRSCEVFLTMNCGKDRLWGEGGPLPPLEALAVGCVPIAFDILGPREFIQSNFSGIIVPRDRPDLMAAALLSVYLIPGELDRLRNNGRAIFQSCHTMDARWPLVKQFLDLDDAPSERVFEKC